MQHPAPEYHNDLIQSDLKLIHSCGTDSGSHGSSLCCQIITIALDQNVEPDRAAATVIYQAEKFFMPTATADRYSDKAHTGAEADADGDLSPPRKRARRSRRRLLRLELPPAEATPLALVGQQLWRGALLLCDYIAAHAATFRGSMVLELGAGLALGSIVAVAAGARVAYATDCHDSVLAAAAQVLDRNAAAIGGARGAVRVRQLDWKAFLGLPHARASLRSFMNLQQQAGKSNTNAGSAESSPAGDGGAAAETVQRSTEYNWRAADLVELSQARYLLAADVIYDEDLTQAFLSAAAYLMAAVAAESGKPPVLLVSTERRVNFSVLRMAPVAAAHDHFLAAAAADFEAQQIDTADLPQVGTYTYTYICIIYCCCTASTRAHAHLSRKLLAKLPDMCVSSNCAYHRTIMLDCVLIWNKT